MLRRGDIVIASSSGSKEVVGKAAQLGDARFAGSFGAFCTTVRPHAEIDASYLGYYFQTSEYRKAISDVSAGSNINNIKSSDLAGHQLPLAPKSEQTRIVAKLEELLSGLDAGVAELKAAQKKLAQYRQSLLKAAVQGDLTADWRRQHPPPETGAELLARILKQRRERWQAKQLAKFAEQGKPPPKGWKDKYPEPAAPNTRDLPALPEGWAWASIEQIADVGTGVTPSRAKAAYFQNGTTPWVTSGALNGEFVTAGSELVSDAALEECRLEIYPTGSLLLAMYGEGKTRGKCSELMIPAAINQAIAAIVLEDGAAKCRRFLKIFLLASYERMREQAAGGVQPNLNLQIVKAIAVPLPPASEQEAIAERLGELLSGVADQVRAVQTGIKQSTAQRQNILRAAFAGQLVPQDPSEEPASLLLERIRAERADNSTRTAKRGRKTMAS